MLIWQNTLYAQTADVITFPVNGTVFQRTNDNHNFSFSGQLQTTGSIRYQIRRRSNIGPVYYWNNVSSGTIVGDNPSTGQTWTVGGTRGFFKNHGNLTTGWYELRLYNNSGNLGTKSYKSTIEFGVGDIYFVAGQSNASGYSYEDDPSIPYTPVSQNRYSRVLKINEGSYSSLSKGLPYQNKFDIFESGNASVPLKPVYPNGQSSWYWNLLAEKIKIPTIFFNNARPGSSVNSGWNGGDLALRNQFLNTLKQYGSILGAKAVLWHQGESDSQELTLSSTVPATYLTAYTANLKNLITDSRNSINGGTNLAWYVSKVSFTTGDNANFGSGIGLNRSNPSPFNPSCTPLSSIRLKEFNNNLLIAQSNVLTGNTNVFEGVSTDALDECQRAPNWRIHFTGSSLETIATAWKARLDATSSNTSVPATELIPLTAVTQSANNYELTSSESTTSTFHWVKNNDGFKSVAGVTGSNSNKFNFLNTSAGDVLTCYILRSNGKIYASQSFKVPTNNVKMIQVSEPALLFGSNANIENSVEITYQNVDWIITNVPSWVNLTYDEENSIAKFTTNSANTTTSSRKQNVYFQEPNGISTFVELTQAAAAPPSGCTATSLLSRPVTGASGNWAANQTVAGNTMVINGVAYPTGATTGGGLNSLSGNFIRYNLGGQYTNFTGKVGRDDAADGCNCGVMDIQFQVLNADNGAVLWTSTYHNIYSPAEAFNVSVAGVQNLELREYVGTDGWNWGDDGDWVQLNLHCGQPASCTVQTPTGVSASTNNQPAGSNIGLSASCASGTATWSTGGTGANIVVNPSVTTVYSVFCNNGSNCTSAAVNITINVVAAGTCSAVVNNLVMGTWNATGNQLVARSFNGSFWLTQRVSASPEQFAVRGSEMLQRGDVSLVNSSYSYLVGCFAYQYSGYGGLQTPTSTVFSTPVGFTQIFFSDGTPNYLQNTNSMNARAAIDETRNNDEIINGLVVSPNPSDGIYNLNFSTTMGSSVALMVTNLSGSVVLQQDFKAASATVNHVINLRTKPNG